MIDVPAPAPAATPPLAGMFPGYFALVMATGIVSIVSALPGEALRIIQPFADQLAGEPVALTAQRWRRGGRS